jgi:adenosylcobinamide kinase/adenosylcobinamide-phosphate guanylyltransferase
LNTLILGGARSGKSRLAERIATGSGRRVTYVATATATVQDAEMQARVVAHQARRPPDWRLIEEPLALAGVLSEHARPDGLLLADCLTLWLTNLLLYPDPGRFARERAALLDVLPKLPGELLLVSNETGLGVVPMSALSRRFCDEAGWLHQDLARLCGRVIFMVAGLPQVLKGEPWNPNG